MNSRYYKPILLLALAAFFPLLAEDRPPPGRAHSSVLLLRLQVVEGEGAVYVAGSRSSSPLTVQAADELGGPVEGVTVSLLMPDDGPAGIFASGLSTEVLVTGKDGRVSLRGIRWGHTPGPVRIRVTASRGKARAGTIATQYIEAPGEDQAPAKRGPSISRPKGKWIAIAAIAAGAAAGGLALGLSGSSAGSAFPAAPPSAGGIQQPPVQVGVPNITIGRP